MYQRSYIVISSDLCNGIKKILNKISSHRYFKVLQDLTKFIFSTILFITMVISCKILSKILQDHGKIFSKILQDICLDRARP